MGGLKAAQIYVGGTRGTPIFIVGKSLRFIQLCIKITKITISQSKIVKIDPGLQRYFQNFTE